MYNTITSLIKLHRYLLPLLMRLFLSPTASTYISINLYATCMQRLALEMFQMRSVRLTYVSHYVLLVIGVTRRIDHHCR